MKVVVGILGVTVGLIAGLATFVLGGAFGMALYQNSQYKDQEKEADKTEEVEEG